MNCANVYVDLDGQVFALAELDVEERRLVERLCRRARTHPDWTDFDNYWTRQVGAFYDARGLSRKRTVKTVPFQIAQDLSSRLGIAAGLIQPLDYRDELERLIRERFSSRRAFCKATGLSADLLEQVLSGRQDLALATLTEALAKIGYSLRILPAPGLKQTG